MNFSDLHKSALSAGDIKLNFPQIASILADLIYQTINLLLNGKNVMKSA
jgi:hypothetical protein